MIYLYGTIHPIQAGIKKEYIGQYKKKLIDTIKKYEIDFLAEEWSEDASKLYQIQQSIASEISTELNINYLACDPSIEEYQTLNLSLINFSDKSNLSINEIVKIHKENLVKAHKREDYWINKINTSKYNNLLFICGWKHLRENSSYNDGVDKKLNNLGIKFEILT